MARIIFSFLMLLVAQPGVTAQAATGDGALLAKFLDRLKPSDLNPSADRYGRPRSDLAVVPLLNGDDTVGWAFLTSDFVSTTGYSGKPIHTVVGIDRDAVVTGLRLVEHAEPIVLIGIPERKMR